MAMTQEQVNKWRQRLKKEQATLDLKASARLQPGDIVRARAGTSAATFHPIRYCLLRVLPGPELYGRALGLEATGDSGALAEVFVGDEVRIDWPVEKVGTHPLPADLESSSALLVGDTVQRKRYGPKDPTPAQYRITGFGLGTPRGRKINRATSDLEGPEVPITWDVIKVAVDGGAA